MNKENLYGTWQLAFVQATNATGGDIPSPWGPRPMGRLVLDSEGRMMAVLCDGRPELPEGTTRAYSSYCGNYRIEDDTLITKVDAAADKSRIGGEQRRGLREQDGYLVLMPPKGENGDGREVFWKKISNEISI